MTHSIDTSALITAWRFHYSPDRFPSVWRRIEEVIRSGDLRASPMVLEELKVGEDDLYEWARKQAGFCVEPDDTEQEYVREIVRDFQGLVKENEDRINADPFVIAFARRHGLTVVTMEAAKGQGYQSKIPYVCSRLAVRCVDLMGFFADYGWTF